MQRLAAPKADQVPFDEVERRQGALRAALPLRLTAILPREIISALQASEFPPGQRNQLLLAVKSRSLHMVWLPVFDSDAVDGDMIMIRTLGLSQTVRLTGQPVAVPVLLPSDGLIHITGIDQGLGGGVTLGIVAGHVPLKLPPLAVGQTVALPAMAVAGA